VSSEKFVEEHGGRVGDIAVYGQESNYTTWKLARMNLAIRGIDANLGPRNADSFRADLHPDLKADFILANPPFNMGDWGGENLQQDVRWKFGMPSVNNANYAWVQHFVHHLAPNGKAGFVLANGSLSSGQDADFSIRKQLIEDDVVDCVVYLPPQLFYTTQISVSLWFLCRNKRNSKERVRNGETLFIYAYRMGSLVDRIHRELSASEMEKITTAYQSWRSARGDYADEPGFCKSVATDEIRKRSYSLVPGKYVGFSPSAADHGDALDAEFISALRNDFEGLSHRISEACDVLEELSDV